MQEPGSLRIGIDSRSLTAIRKTKCRRLAAMAYVGSDAIAVARSRGGEAVSFESSGAYAFGRAFEDSLLRSRGGVDAAGLQRAFKHLMGSNVVPAVIDLGGRSIGSDRLAAYVAFKNYIVARKKHHVDAAIVLGSALRFPGRSEMLLPDCLYFAPGQTVPVPVEIKAYEFRGPLTSQESIDSAVSQCALYAVAFESDLDFGLSDSTGIQTGWIVLRELGRRTGVALSYSLTRAKVVVSEACDDLPQDDVAFLSEFEIAPVDFESDPSRIFSVKPNFCETCRISCSLYNVCRVEERASVRSLSDGLVDLVGDVSLQNVLVGASFVGEDRGFDQIAFAREQVRALRAVRDANCA